MSKCLMWIHWGGECKMIPGEECQIMEMDESYQHCSVVKDGVERRERKCSYEVRGSSQECQM